MATTHYVSLKSIGLLFTAFVLMAAGHHAFGTTVIKHGAQVSGVWSAEGSPYIIEGLAVIERGDTLILEAGTLVVLQNGFVGSTHLNATTLNESFDRGSIVSRGILTSNGAKGNPVIITGNNKPGSPGTLAILDGLAFFQHTIINIPAETEIRYPLTSAHIAGFQSVEVLSTGASFNHCIINTHSPTLLGNCSVYNSIISNASDYFYFRNVEFENNLFITAFSNRVFEDELFLKKNNYYFVQSENKYIKGTIEKKLGVLEATETLYGTYFFPKKKPRNRNMYVYDSTSSRHTEPIALNLPELAELRLEHIGPPFAHFRNYAENKQLGLFKTEGHPVEWLIGAAPIANGPTTDERGGGRRAASPYTGSLPALETLSFHALLISVEEYKDEGLDPLSFPIKEANALSAILVNQYNFKEANIIKLHNPTKAQVYDKFNGLRATLTENDQLIILYSGHGTLAQGTGFWLLSDANLKKEESWMPNSETRRLIAGLPTRHTLLINDCCFGGSILRSTLPTAAVPIVTAFKKPSRTVMTSGSLYEQVPDNSVFMKYLLKALRNNQETVCTATSFYASFYKAVERNSNHRPQYGYLRKTGDEGGDFIFFLKPTD